MDSTQTQPTPLFEATASHPVQLSIDRPTHASRLHVITRAVILLALGALCSSSIYWVLYLILPAVAALVVSHKGGQRALAEDGTRAVHALRWLASAHAYLWLLTDTLPTTGAGPVDLRIEKGPPPTPGSALLRLLYSIPAGVLLVIMLAVASVLWLVGAVWILAVERMPTFIRDFLTLTLRFQFRLGAYHLSLVDRYPSLEDSAAHRP
jgi:hypothetical protein